LGYDAAAACRTAIDKANPLTFSAAFESLQHSHFAISFAFREPTALGLRNFPSICNIQFRARPLR
jgi:hypothetical protein